MCHLISSLIIPAHISLTKTQSTIATHVALDFFVRDIQAMRQSAHTWKKISPEELIWHKEGYDIGWRFDHHRLERREGVYEKTTWKEAKKSIVLNNITQALFTLEMDKDQVVGTTLKIINHYASDKPVTCYVAALTQQGK
jgi:hypothetical protein